MSAVTVITNHVPRDVVEAWQLTQEERAEFDYLPWDAIDRGEDGALFVRYRGELLDLGEFERWENPSSPLGARWDAMRADTFFSGVLIRYADNQFESVVVGRYYA